MKRLLLFVSVFLALTTIANAQGSRRVLLEEFTSSTCPPCAATDPIMEKFEAAAFDSICVLKWHQRFPSPGNDPAYAIYPDAEARLAYYGVQGIPGVVLNGNPYFNPGSGLQYLEDSLRNVYDAMTDNYSMSVTQQITSDSIIALVTVKTAAGITNPPNIHIAAVFAERFFAYHGTNGRYYHESVVRWSAPALSRVSADTGAITGVFSQAPGTTQTYRFAAKLLSGWNKKQLMTVSFLQVDGSRGLSKKEVLQSAWTVPLDLTPVGGTVLVAGSPNQKVTYALTNKNANAIKVRITLNQPTAASGYAVGLTGFASDSTLIVPANGNTTFSLNATSSGSTAIKNDLYSFQVSTIDSIGVGGKVELIMGKDITTLVLDAGAGFYTQTYQSPANIMSALTYNKVPAISLSTSDLADKFGDWSAFKTVFFDAGVTVGLYTNTNDTSTLKTFLANGGKFIMMSQQMASVYEAASLDQYIKNVFHLSTTGASQAAWTTLSGVTADPVGKGIMNAVVSNVVYTMGLNSYDEFAHSVFYDENGDTVGVRSELPNGGKTLYLSFELGNVAPATMLRTLVKNIIDWSSSSSVLGGPISLSGLYASANPFSGSTNITYVGSSDEQNVQCAAYNLLGEEVAKLTVRNDGNNQYSAVFNGDKLANGTYIIAMHSSKGSREIRVVNKH